MRSISVNGLVTFHLGERSGTFPELPYDHFLFGIQGSKNLFSITRQGGSKRKVLVAKVAV